LSNPFRMRNTWIRSPLSLRFSKLCMPSNDNLSSYDFHLSPLTNLVALRCTFSKQSISFFNKVTTLGRSIPGVDAQNRWKAIENPLYHSSQNFSWLYQVGYLHSLGCCLLGQAVTDKSRTWHTFLGSFGLTLIRLMSQFPLLDFCHTWSVIFASRISAPAFSASLRISAVQRHQSPDL